ncbi:hypothetical protein [Microbaculum marinum]|uniref:Gluconate 2-dehydrogenase subunit 3 family protein n=1 Tax=Microbaculum marinum TaxID=1764581 RepID=A0AAW9RJM7_9HYPH
MSDEPASLLLKRDREVFAAIADVLIPAAEGMPSATALGIEGEPMDHVLALRPELANDLLRGLRAAAGAPDGAAAAERLNREDPAAMGAIGLVASAAYYMQPQVWKLLGYPGQTHRPVRPEEEDDFRENDLLQPVIDRGPIYRPTPD